MHIGIEIAWPLGLRRRVFGSCEFTKTGFSLRLILRDLLPPL